MLAGYKSALRKMLNSQGTIFALIVSVIVEIVTMLGTTFWQIVASRRIGVPNPLLPIFPMVRNILTIILFFTVISRIKQTNLKWPLYGGFISSIFGYILLISIKNIGMWGYVVLFISLFFEALGGAVLNTLRESLVAIHADPEERSGIMALLQTAIMLISVPFGYIGGLLSDISKALPFVLSIILLLLGIGVTAAYYHRPWLHRSLKIKENIQA